MSSGSSKTAVHLPRTLEKQRATSDYAQLRTAEHEKTVRLRALRLAKEATDRGAADEAAAAKAAAKRPATKRRKAVAARLPIDKTLVVRPKPMVPIRLDKSPHKINCLLGRVT